MPTTLFYFIIIIIKLYLNTALFHKLLTFNLIMYKREGKEYYLNVTNTNNIKVKFQLIILSFALKIFTVSEFLISLGRLFQATAPL